MIIRDRSSEEHGYITAVSSGSRLAILPNPGAGSSKPPDPLYLELTARTHLSQAHYPRRPYPRDFFRLCIVQSILVLGILLNVSHGGIHGLDSSTSILHRSLEQSCLSQGCRLSKISE